MTLLTPTRRNLLGGLVGLIAAPAVVHAANLMPISVWKEIRWASTEGCPMGWVRCDGGLLKCSDYPELFDVLGNAHGGDGITTFAVPQISPFVSRIFNDPVFKIMNASQKEKVIGETFSMPVGETTDHITPKPVEDSGGFYGANNAEAKEIGAKYTEWERDYQNRHKIFQYPLGMEHHYQGVK